VPPLTRRILIQLVIFATVALVGGAVMVFGYIQVPAMFGIGRYRVTVELPQAAGLYTSGNVTYRGTEVGRVESVHLTETGVAAVLSLKSGIDIPSDLDAQVHSRSAVGEQYVTLLPRRDSPPLKNGDVIPGNRVSVPPDLDTMLDAVNRGMESIPRDNLKTVVDEAYTAVGGLGPEISRLVSGSSSLSSDARKNLDALLVLIDQSKPVLDTQTGSADAVRAWASHLADISRQLRDNDPAVRAVLRQTGPAATEVRQLFDRLNPTLPIVLANLIGVGQVALTYHPGIEQLLVLLPQAVATVQAIGVPNRNTKQSYKGAFLSFNLRLNLPPPCLTGFLPPQQQRVPSWDDYPDRPAGDLYCRVPQDSPKNVRGVRNTPCVNRPGKRAPTVGMCEGDESYVPLNDGYNWKGDPNATLSGQPVPQLPADTPPAPAQVSQPLPIPAAEYDPATGTYVGPDGRVYTRSDLGAGGRTERTWQKMLLPPN
jgi:phospholipid/cholesterol/gamma-HCH transport system substrate-binding protein